MSDQTRHARTKEFSWRSLLVANLLLPLPLSLAQLLFSVCRYSGLKIKLQALHPQRNPRSMAKTLFH
jgi:hypothetical protein